MSDYSTTITGPQLRALAPFASSDLARVNLTPIAFLADGRAMATDGHRGMVFSPGDSPTAGATPAGDTPADRRPRLLPRELWRQLLRAATRQGDEISISWDGSAVRAVLARFGEPPQVFTGQAPSTTFPPLWTIVSGVVALGPADGGSGAAFNPAYLGDVGKALALVANVGGCARLTIAAPLEPILVEIDTDAGRWCHILMPMRDPGASSAKPSKRRAATRAARKARAA